MLLKSDILETFIALYVWNLICHGVSAAQAFLCKWQKWGMIEKGRGNEVLE